MIGKIKINQIAAKEKMVNQIGVYVNNNNLKYIYLLIFMSFLFSIHIDDYNTSRDEYMEGRAVGFLTKGKVRSRRG